MGFEINKLFAAILVTVLFVFGIGKISDIIFNGNETNVVAYKVEAPAGSNSETKADSSVDIAAIFALGNVDHGKKVFKKCAACHSISIDGQNKILLAEGKEVYFVDLQDKDPSEMGFKNFTKLIQNTVPMTYSSLLEQKFNYYHYI